MTAFNIPAGFALVPLEPTRAMCKAFYEVGPDDGFMASYSTMLAVAPPVDAVLGEPVDAETWAELYRLREAVKGPRGFATWQDAAVDERHRRVKAEAALAASVAVSSAAARDLLAERRRQVEAEGYSADHDAAHGTSELSLAAAAYALSSVHGLTAKSLSPWPWETRSFKPKHPYRDLERAGALVLAAMECWQRRFLRKLDSDQEFVESRRLSASVASRAGSEPVAKCERCDSTDVLIHRGVLTCSVCGTSREHADKWQRVIDEASFLANGRGLGDLLRAVKDYAAPIAPAAAAEPSDPLQELTDLSQEMGLYEVPAMNTDRTGVASLVASEVQPAHEEIHAHFKLHHGGPNPYYACVHCGDVEPGLEEYLVKHMRKCSYGPRASAGEAQS